MSPTSGTGSRHPPTSTASAPADLDLWRDELLARPDRGEGADRARPRSRRRRRATRASAASKPRATATRAPSPRSSTRSASRRRSRRTTVLRARRSRSPTTARARRPATASRPVVRSPISTSSRSRVDAVDRAVPPARREADRRAAHPGRSSTRSSPAPCSACCRARSTASRCLKGRSLFAGREGETIAAPIVEIVDDPTDPRAFGARRLRQRRAADAPQRADRRRRAARLPAQRLHRPAIGAAQHRAARCAAATPRRPGVGVRALTLRPGTRVARGDHGGGRRGVLRAVGERAALRHQPDQRRLLGRRRRAHGARRRVRGAGARGDDRVDAATHAARRRPRSAPISRTCPARPPGVTMLVGEMTLSGV